jgi:hypothetical protein
VWRVVILLAACGGNQPTKANTMVASNVSLETLGAPHVAVFVTSPSGLHRVWLDTGRIDVLSKLPDAIPLSETAYLEVDGGRYTINHLGKERIYVDGVTPNKLVVLSPDRTKLAIAQSDFSIAIVTVEGGVVHRIRRPLHDERIDIAWTKDSAALLVVVGEDRQRIDLASGDRTPADQLDWDANAATAPTDCTSRGLRLERRLVDGKQALVLVTLAAKANPEQLASTRDRVLLTATNHGHNARRWSEQPAPLEPKLFTPTCDHFVFTLEDRVYAGSVATGHHAFLMRGDVVH